MNKVDLTVLGFFLEQSEQGSRSSEHLATEVDLGESWKRYPFNWMTGSGNNERGLIRTYHQTRSVGNRKVVSRAYRPRW